MLSFYWKPFCTLGLVSVGISALELLIFSLLDSYCSIVRLGKEKAPPYSAWMPSSEQNDTDVILYYQFMEMPLLNNQDVDMHDVYAPCNSHCLQLHPVLTSVQALQWAAQSCYR